MPNQHVSPSEISVIPGTPTPCTITPALLKQHSITPDEYTRLEEALGRTPSLTELGIFSVMWSEHCSYKSSRVHLKRLPTRGTRLSGPGSVVQGPGENAGIIDVGDGWACAFKIESHNHPSYIEPYQGAATGVGGILRDIFTMGARPLAVMDSLRFGPLAPPSPSLSSFAAGDALAFPLSSFAEGGGSASPLSSFAEGGGSASPAPPPAPDLTDYAKNHQVANGVVHGVAGYGNCFGVPNLGGETRFEPCYSGNPLLNAFALGLVRKDEIFYAAATGVGNPVFYVGAKTGRDGIHGATMASEEFTEGSEQKRPNVQMGDPFLEKLLLEACLEVMKTGAVLGIQDMGAAGLTCSTCEMGAKGELGVSIELDLVPQRETGMSAYEIMLSESQERMLLVAQKGREQEVLDVFEKWGLDCAEVGIVTADDIMRVRHHGELVAEIPNKALTDNAPVYHRPVGTWTPPVPRDPPDWVLKELQKPRDYTADLLKLLASPNICDKRYIYEQYDSMVQTNTVQGPGFEAGIIRIKGTGSTSPQPASAPSPNPITSASLSSVAANPPSLSSPAAPPPSLSSFAAAPPSLSAPATPPPSLSSFAAGGGSASPAPSSFSTSEAPATPPPSLSSFAAGGASASPAHLPNPLPETPAAKLAAANDFDPIAAEHSIAGKLLNLIAGSTPQGEATLAAGHADAANPVLAPDASHVFADTPKPERGIAMALAGNGRWCFLDPRLGAMHAVAEAARKVACTGATPVAATNCLNFGNPEKPEIMAQLSAAIDGIAEAATALGTPITGGNVSLYNETRGEGIYPTPVIGVVGLLEDVTKAVPNSFQRVGDAVLLVQTRHIPEPRHESILSEFGVTEFARVLLGTMWGQPPAFSVMFEAEQNSRLHTLCEQSKIKSACDVGSGGLAVAICRASLQHGIGAATNYNWRTDLAPSVVEALGETAVFFDETPALLLTCSLQDRDVVMSEFLRLPLLVNVCHIGETTLGSVSFRTDHFGPHTLSLASLRAAFSNTLESQLAAEVVTA